MAKKKNGLNGFYVIKNDKFIELALSTDRTYYILCDMLKTQAALHELDNWGETQIPHVIEYVGVMQEIKKFLEALSSDPAPEVVQLAIENNIEDMLLSQKELDRLNVLLKAAEEYEKELGLFFNTSTEVN